MKSEIEYIRSDKTIERFLLNDKTLIVFNNQGLYFDVFFSEKKLSEFLVNKSERGDYFFDNENDLSSFLDFNC